jgi:hypothetical protein
MICENCDQPAAPHKLEECLQELVRKRKIADDMFNAAVTVINLLGEPEDIQDKKLQQASLSLDLVTWRYAM